ncbi:MarR family transcriptional regulator [soil metagenome]
MSTSNWLAADEERAWRGYRRMITVLESRLARELADGSDLSMTDYEVLSTLSEADDHRWRITELAERMCWSPSRLSHHLTRMERRDLVERDSCPTDGRGTVVRLTDGGMATLVAAAPDHVASVRRHLFDHLDDDEVHALARLSWRVADHLT